MERCDGRGEAKLGWWKLTPTGMNSFTPGFPDIVRRLSHIESPREQLMFADGLDFEVTKTSVLPG